MLSFDVKKRTPGVFYINPLWCDVLWRGFWVLQSDCMNTQNLQSHWFSYSNIYFRSHSLTAFLAVFLPHLDLWVMCLSPGCLADAPLFLCEHDIKCEMGGHHSVLLTDWIPVKTLQLPLPYTSATGVTAPPSTTSSRLLHEISGRGSVMQGHAWQGDNLYLWGEAQSYSF